MMFYLTDHDYEIAEQNGISHRTAYQRVYNYGWPIEKAITKKPGRKNELYIQYEELCHQNGVSSDLFLKRLKKGMQPEEAASKPPTPHRPFGRYEISRFYDAAAKNGINPNTVRNRVYTLGWSVEKAITVPPLKHN